MIIVNKMKAIIFVSSNNGVIMNKEWSQLRRVWEYHVGFLRSNVKKQKASQIRGIFALFICIIYYYYLLLLLLPLTCPPSSIFQSTSHSYHFNINPKPIPFPVFFFYNYNICVSLSSLLSHLPSPSSCWTPFLVYSFI